MSDLPDGYSTPEHAPRGMEFLYSLNRLNVATSRARCVARQWARRPCLRSSAERRAQMKLANGRASRSRRRARCARRATDLSAARRRNRTYRPSPRPGASRRPRPRQTAGAQHARCRRGAGKDRHIAAITVATIVAQDLLGLKTMFAGHRARPWSSGRHWARRCRRSWRGRTAGPGLTTGYTIGVLGALVATAAVITRSFPLLMLAPRSSASGTPPTSCRATPPRTWSGRRKRASAIGLVVLVMTVGSVIGPALIASDLAAGAGLPPLAGPYLVPVVFVGLAAILSFTLLRPAPRGRGDPRARGGAAHDDEAAWAIIRRPAVAAAIIALVASQFVMVLIMTMTPPPSTDDSAPSASRSRRTRSGCSPSRHCASRGPDDLPRYGGARGVLDHGRGRAARRLLGCSSRCSCSASAGTSGTSRAARCCPTTWCNERTRIQGTADALIWSACAGLIHGRGRLYVARGVLGAAVVIIPVALAPASRTAPPHPRRVRAAAGQRLRGLRDLRHASSAPTSIVIPAITRRMSRPPGPVPPVAARTKTTSNRANAMSATPTPRLRPRRRRRSGSSSRAARPATTPPRPRRPRSAGRARPSRRGRLLRTPRDPRGCGPSPSGRRA